MSSWMNINLQDPNSPMGLIMLVLHDFTMLFMTTIMVVISYIICMMMFNKYNDRYFLSNNTMELVWTILPMLVLIAMAIPSIQALYLSEENWNPSITIKTIGHQWYWSYEYTEFNVSFDSYMVTEHYQSIFRLIDVDNRMIIPANNCERIIITSTDVIHSWTIPSFAIKVDAIPGRINQAMIYTLWEGLFFGQCSEICGMNHSFMPICVEVTTVHTFISWVITFK